ncbi:MAG: thioredoxin-disulfide reductase [Methanocellales archaeon]|nr:thioredoxin-disulfide reductase [Methanocellales archaeon]MDD4898908.1 thioredoxin-disulfide reductase [Methanocellales archaeon]MDD5447493.1 thioredoxin-disulfide reductase [Methanocellales archaeon]
MGNDVVVIGAGPAGLTAGIYAARSGLRTFILEKATAGGLASEAWLIENYPGFDSIEGMKLMDQIKNHASKYVSILYEEVKNIETGKKVTLYTDQGTYTADAVILATGSLHKKLGIQGEAEFLGKGVSYCAACDGFFFRGKKVLVVGGGNTAATEAIYLQSIGCDVTLVHRRDQLRAENSLQKRLLRSGVNAIWNSVVEEIRGKGLVKTVLIHDLREDVLHELDVDGVFILVGEYPNNTLAKAVGLKLDGQGYIITDKKQRTSLPRVYAAGDVTGGVRQIVVACAEGAIAALSASEDLSM